MRQEMFHGILLNLAFEDKGYPEKYHYFSRKVSGDSIIYGIEVAREDLEDTITDIQSNMKTGGQYYSQLYDDEVMIVIFKGLVFRLVPDRSSWTDAQQFGRDLGIAEAQLDFYPCHFQDEDLYFPSNPS